MAAFWANAGMRISEVITGILSGISVVLLTVIARSIVKTTKEFRRFMIEHLWLLSTTLWTRDKVVKIMNHLNMAIDQPPPDNLKEK